MRRSSSRLDPVSPLATSGYRARTMLKASEAFYREVFNASTVAVWHFDTRQAVAFYAELRAHGVTDIVAYAKDHPDFVPEALAKLRVVDVNETALRLFGARTRADVVGGSAAPYWDRMHFDSALAVIRASFENEPSFRAEMRMRTVDGRDIDVLFTVAVSPELRAAGHSLVEIIDITDLVRAQNTLAEMQSTFVQAARVSVLGEITASIAHELNQPLSAITSYGDASLRWLDRPVPNVEEVRRITARIIADARRVSDIIARIRALAPPWVHPPEHLSVAALLQEAMLFLRPDLRRLGLTEALELEDGLPGVLGDRAQLQQVLVNVTLNALQAMDGLPSPRLHLRAARSLPDTVRLEIEDSGAGIAKENIDRVFDSFYTTKKIGMGIGLPICRSIVEAHEGTIALENIEGGGVRVVIILPAAP